MLEGTVIPGPMQWLAGPGLLEYLVVDVFTTRALEGNQLGVFLDGRSLGEVTMRRIARELNFAETVFLLPSEPDSDVRVRIFTPRRELPFAGHPVLGTAFVVGTALGSDSVVLQTGAGPVPISLQREDGRIVFGRMQQPIPTWEPFENTAELLAAVGVPASELPVEIYRNGPEHVYVALPTEQAVVSLAPDMARLTDLGVAANCFAGSGRSWKTRMFYPATGVPEDPATGSAAGPLSAHLARHGWIEFGQEIEIRQGEEIGRPSILYARATGTPDRIDTIEVGGSARIVAHGRFAIDPSSP
jgi:trans-2,3-dihydro-3-hydroxyanthranilate isomerase